MKKENQLLNKLVKLVTGEGKPEVVEAVAPEAVEQVVEAVEQVAEAVGIDTNASAELESVKAELATASASIAEFGVKLEEAVAALAEMTTKYEEAEATIAKMVGEAVTAKMAARHAKIVAAIGTEKSDALMSATESLDDAAFEAVVSAMAGSVDAEAKTDLFNDVGVAAEADAAKVVEESKEMKLLKQKYGNRN